MEREGSLYVELTPLERELAATAGSGGVSGRIRYSKEPLPWEGYGMDEDEGSGENGIDGDDESSMGWSYSPWGGEFRHEVLSDRDDENYNYSEDSGNGGDEDLFYYEEDDGDEEVGQQGRRGTRGKTRLALSQRQRQRHRHQHQRQQQQQQQQDGFSVLRVDNDDGAAVVEEQDWSRLELTTQAKAKEEAVPPIDTAFTTTEIRPKEVTQLLKEEASGELGKSVTNQDPNVNDNDAEGAAQKISPGNTQQYVEVPLAGSFAAAATEEDKAAGPGPGPRPGGRSFAAESPVSSEPLDSSVEEEVEVVRPKLDQIALLGHEAEMDWLQEQDDIQRARRTRDHHDGSRRFEKEEDEDESEWFDQGEAEVDDGEDRNEEDGDDVGIEEISLGGDDGGYENIVDPAWDFEHGGLHPQHIRKPGMRRSIGKDRAEHVDRDEDGTIFPKTYSQDPLQCHRLPNNP
ncbi:hypothetical protein BGX23_008699 [Mortierella sp. AD031]|nr:hypothetical protein BGX23_008699 [Mortierella sp. AD031]KAG0220439.1 hypothetical protein BGX33_000114 [Mortierella sp. NVP41]